MLVLVVEIEMVLQLMAEIKPIIGVEPDEGLRREVGEARRLALRTPLFDVAVAQHVLAPVAELPPHPLHQDIDVLLLKSSKK